MEDLIILVLWVLMIVGISTFFQPGTDYSKPIVMSDSEYEVLHAKWLEECFIIDMREQYKDELGEVIR